MVVQERIDPGLASDPEFGSKVQRASLQLRELVAESNLDVTADWKLVRTKDGQRKIQLELADPPTVSEVLLGPEELDTAGELRRALGWFWGGFALARAKRLIRESRELAVNSEVGA